MDSQMPTGSSHEKSGSFDNPISLSREASLKRNRGYSTGGSSTSLQRLARNAPTTVALENTGRRPSFDHSYIRKPSLSRSHSRQTSHTLEPALFRSATAGPLTSELQSSTNGIPTWPDDRPGRRNNNNDSSNTRAHEERSQSRSGQADLMSPSERLAASASHEYPPGKMRVDRMHSGAARKDFQSRSQSAYPTTYEQSEGETAGEFALEHLFSSFRNQADYKLNQCAASFMHTDARVETICGPGVDAHFDQLISTMAQMSRTRPKPLIDRVMQWRQEYADIVPQNRMDVNGVKNSSVSPTNNDALVNGLNGAASSSGAPKTLPRAAMSHTGIMSAEPRSSIATYIVCRVLMEVFRRSSLDALTPELTEKFREIVYTRQLHSLSQETVERSPLQSAKWTVVTQLLGVMSELDFQGVSQKFQDELQHFQKELGVKGMASQKTESDAAFIMRSMKYLVLPAAPEAVWDQTIRFMGSIADFFAGVHGQSSKISCCRLVEKLLLSLPRRTLPDFNKPAWRKVTYLINDRVNQLVSKPKYWQYAFPVQAILVCVSANDIFASKWQASTIALTSRLNQRNNRATALKATCRLVSMYYQRTQDSAASQARMAEELTRGVFFSGKKYSITMEPAIAEPLIQLIRIIANASHDRSFKSIVFPLLNADILLSTKDVKELKLDQLDPDRSVIAIRAFLAIMNDLEKGESPPFPVKFVDERFLEALPGTPQHQKHSMGHRTRAEKISTTQVDRLSRIVVTSGFTDAMKENYSKMCDIISKIMLMCDPVYGGQAPWTEKISTPTPKTPISETLTTMGRREDGQSFHEERDSFYELFLVAVQTIPRCITSHVPLNPILSVLCSATAHTEKDIATAAAISLKSIARQGHAHAVVDRLSGFILGYDARYSAGFDGAMLDPIYIESALKIYVDVLNIWIQDLVTKSSKSAAGPPDEARVTRPVPLDATTMNQTDRVESQGLFFLCSPSSRVRKLAVEILSQVPRLDSAFAPNNYSRIYSILRAGPWTIMSTKDKNLTVSERTLLERGRRKGASYNSIADICSSEHEAGLWRKVFPCLIRACNDVCQVTVAETRQDVCKRLSQMHHMIESLDERLRMPSDTSMTRGPRRQSSDTSTISIEQWKLYLMFACSTLTRTESSSSTSTTTQESQHARKASKSSQTTQDSFNSALDLFGKVIPFLGSSNSRIRDAAVEGLGAINVNIYKSLLEALDTIGPPSSEDAKRTTALHQRVVSSPKRPASHDHLVTEVARVYRLTAHYLVEKEIYQDTWILNHLANYTKNLNLTIRSQEQSRSNFDKLRLQYCGLIEAFFVGINETSEPEHWMAFQPRRAAFSLMEEWCGHLPHQDRVRHGDMSPNQHQAHERNQSVERTRMIQSTEEGRVKKDLKTAALSAMATLCAGPISVTTGNTTLQFDVKRIAGWIEAMFNAESDRDHDTGQRALKNVITHNPNIRYFIEKSIEMLYLATTTKAVESYIGVLYDVFLQEPPLDASSEIPFWRILSALLFALGSDSKHVRRKASRLLRVVDERQGKRAKLQDLDGSVTGTTAAVAKKAQFEISERLAETYSEHAFFVFSEVSKYFKTFNSSQKRNVVVTLLPWIKTIELQLDVNRAPTASSYMLLVNLLEITLASTSTIHLEIQALWQALAAGPHGGNVKMILDFIRDLALERKEIDVVQIARQIVVFLSTTEAGKRVIESLLQDIGPRSMTGEKRREVIVPPEAYEFPYLATFHKSNSDSRQSGISEGQLSLILLVDLMTCSASLPAERVPSLLQIVLVLWDHHLEIVREQAQEMLVHLLHGLVMSKLDDQNSSSLREIENFIETIGSKNPKVIWTYEDNEGKDSKYELSPSLTYVITQTLKSFSLLYPSIAPAWGRTAIEWATLCPVRHLACRSLQIYRCIITPIDQRRVIDILGRLAITIGDDEDDIQTYALELIRALRTIVDEMTPQDGQLIAPMFWTICVCLDSIHEPEFAEGLAMLEIFMDKYDLGDAAILALLKKPSGWEWPLGGVTRLIYNGCRSGNIIDKCLKVLDRLIKVPSHPLVGDDDRLLFTLLANLPRFAHAVKTSCWPPHVVAAAATLSDAALVQGYSDLASVLAEFTHFRSNQYHDFITQMLNVIHPNFLPRLTLQTLTFLIGLLTNSSQVVKAEVLSVLSVLVPKIDLGHLDLGSSGSDLISPLLRLLQSDLCAETLQVLEFFMAIPGSSFGKQHLRMSMAGSRTSRAARKQYGNVQSLYGIPEPSGWSTPMPLIHRDALRNNVQAIYGTYADISAIQVSPGLTPDVEFYKEERPHNSSYFLERTATMTSDEATLADTNMGELAEKLDSLDDFFDDAVSSSGLQYSYQFPPQSSEMSMSIRNYGSGFYEQSLSRNTSISSISEMSRLPPVREPAVMSPSAFSASLAPAATCSGDGGFSGRPTLNRAMTSPAVQQYQPQRQDHHHHVRAADKSISSQSNNEESEPFSDDDTPLSRVSTSDASLSMDAATTLPSRAVLPVRKSSIKNGVRSSFRRLTGERQQRSIPRSTQQNSPEVPKVPSVYLNTPKSSDL